MFNSRCELKREFVIYSNNKSYKMLRDIIKCQKCEVNNEP